MRRPLPPQARDTQDEKIKRAAERVRHLMLVDDPLNSMCEAYAIQRAGEFREPVNAEDAEALLALTITEFWSRVFARVMSK